MVNNHGDNNNGQTSTDNMHGTATTKHVEKKEAACYSPSTSSEDMNEENDFFQIEGPILSSQFSLGTPAEVLGQSLALDHEFPDPKRIPSSVFTRSKSMTPTDWSITSNESLFSINVGNTSFSKDHMFLYGKSGELGNPNNPLAPLPPLPRESQGSSFINGEVEPMSIGESSAKVKPPALREKADGDVDYMNGNTTSFAFPMNRTGHESHRSDGSTTSFAFPILTGEERSSGCPKDNHPGLSGQSTTQLSQLAEPHDEEEEIPEAITEAPKVEEAPVPAAAAQPPPPATAKWFPCCSCCPLCC